jgi:hypothetical protein
MVDTTREVQNSHISKTLDEETTSPVGVKYETYFILTLSLPYLFLSSRSFSTRWSETVQRASYAGECMNKASAAGVREQASMRVPPAPTAAPARSLARQRASSRDGNREVPLLLPCSGLRASVRCFDTDGVRAPLASSSSPLTGARFAREKRSLRFSFFFFLIY